jgi:hypothetical protein
MFLVIWAVKTQVYRIVTITILTICDSVLWRLKTVTMRLVLENFKSLGIASSFFTFCDRQLITKTVTLRRSEMWSFVTNLLLAKSGHNEDGYKSFKSPSLAGFFVTICDLVYVYFYTSQQIIIRSTFASGEHWHCIPKYRIWSQWPKKNVFCDAFCKTFVQLLSIHSRQIWDTVTAFCDFFIRFFVTSLESILRLF